MASPAYLLQATTFARTRLLTSSFVSRVCFRQRPPPLQLLSSSPVCNPPYTFHYLCSKAAEPKFPTDTPQDSTSSTKPSGTTSNPSTSAQSPEMAPNTDQLLSAFDSYIDEIENEAEHSLSPAERNRLNKERQEAAAREAHHKRLEVLSSLPLDLVVESVPTKCPGCGTTLQSKHTDRPGYLPEAVLREFGEDALIPKVVQAREDLPPDKPNSREPICQRCYRLKHYGAIESHLRVNLKKGASNTPSGIVKKPDMTQPVSLKACKELSPETFRKTLERLRSINAVIIYLVDIFDFHGSSISSLRNIVGLKNPVVLAANKVDLLPKDYKASRVEGWIRHECASLGLRDIASFHLISSVKGTGIRTLLAEALSIAKSRRADIYVIGAANVGKSSFINQLIDIRKSDKLSKVERRDRKKPSAKSQSLGTITTSVVPGTTLDVIRIPLGGKVSLFDTPGLMMPHQLTNYLAEKELKAVIPPNKVDAVTFRLEEGKALFIGALARLEVLEGRSFFFTCFFSPMIKLHPGKIENSVEFAQRHVGELLTPPYSEEGLSRLGEWTAKTFTGTGDSWKKASVDIVFSGLGWVAMTGPGSVRLRLCVPQGVGVFTREPLMPFEVQSGVSRYTGTNAVNKRQQKRAMKKRKQSLGDEVFE